MTFRNLLVEDAGAVRRITLNRPDTRNALSGEAMFAAFEQTFAALNADLNVRVAILTGAGSAFCSGGNVAEMRDRSGMFAGSPEEITERYRQGIQRVESYAKRLADPASPDAQFYARADNPAFSSLQLGDGPLSLLELAQGPNRFLFSLTDPQGGLLAAPDVRVKLRFYDDGADPEAVVFEADDMVGAMHDAEGIGLAAQQVGRALQLCVIDLTAAPDLAAGDWVDVPWNIADAAQQNALSAYEILTVIGSRLRRR